MAFNLRKNNHKDTTNIIQYNYYKTPFYKNHYEKTAQNGGYIKIPYHSQPNTPNLILDNEYITQNIIISKKIHTIENVDFDGELIIEHISSTNTKPLYVCILLKTEDVFDTPIDHMIRAKDDFTLHLNELLFMYDCTQCIFYESKMSSEMTPIIVFTEPILVRSNFDAFSKVMLFHPDNNIYSIVRIQPILGNKEGFGLKEGIDSTITTNVGYCQLIDENDPTISNEAQVIVPLHGTSVTNEAANSVGRVILNFCAFSVILLFAIIGIPFIYDLFIVKLVLKNVSFSPQKKLNRLSAVDMYTCIVIFALGFSMINVGVSNDIPLYTSIGFFVFIFLIACYCVIQGPRMFLKSYADAFLAKFNTQGSSETASYDKVENDWIGLLYDNFKALWGTTIFVLIFIFLIIYMFMKFAGLTDIQSSSFFMSLPFYGFLLSIYIAILFKYYIEQPIAINIKSQVKNVLSSTVNPLPIK